MRDAEGCPGRDTAVLTEPIWVADMKESPRLSRRVGGGDSDEGTACASVVPSAVIDAGAGASDESLRSIEASPSRECTFWAASGGVVCVGDCAGKDGVACAATGGVVCEGTARDNSAGGLGSFGYEAFMEDKNRERKTETEDMRY
jgi:hypothetical protein